MSPRSNASHSSLTISTFSCDTGLLLQPHGFEGVAPCLVHACAGHLTVSQRPGHRSESRDFHTARSTAPARVRDDDDGIWWHVDDLGYVEAHVQLLHATGQPPAPLLRAAVDAGIGTLRRRPVQLRLSGHVRQCGVEIPFVAPQPKPTHHIHVLLRHRAYPRSSASRSPTARASPRLRNKFTRSMRPPAQSNTRASRNSTHPLLPGGRPRWRSTAKATPLPRS